MREKIINTKICIGLNDKQLEVIDRDLLEMDVRVSRSEYVRAALRKYLAQREREKNLNQEGK